MPTVYLTIDAELCGPIGVGTVEVIKLIRLHLAHDLADAKHLVDRAVFEGERVAIPAPSADAALMFVDALARLGPRPRIHVVVGEP